MISPASQLTWYNELYLVVKRKIQRNSIKVGKKDAYTNKVLSFQKYPLDILKKTKKGRKKGKEIPTEIFDLVRQVKLHLSMWFWWDNISTELIIPVRINNERKLILQGIPLSYPAI